MPYLDTQFHNCVNIDLNELYTKFVVTPVFLVNVKANWSKLINYT